MDEQLYRIRETGQGELREKGSKFFAYAIPVVTQEQVEEELNAIRKKYHDARHHCYAWRLGQTGDQSLANDDGEPSHSAGDPILAAIRSAGVTDVLVVVVRYFGGVKLGVRGLIEAYRGAAQDAIESLEKEAIIPRIYFRVDFGYEETSQINKIMHPFDVKQEEANYTDVCSVTYSIKVPEYAGVEKAFEDRGRSVTFLKEEY